MTMTRILALALLGLCSILIVASKHAMAQAYKLIVSEPLTPALKSWIEKNEKWTTNLGGGQCLFKQFDIAYGFRNLTGPCSVSPADVEALQTGKKTLHFTVLAVTPQGAERPNSSIEMVCRRNDKAWIGSVFAGRTMLCQMQNVTGPDGLKFPDANRYGLHLVALNPDAYYPMGPTGDAPWLNLAAVKNAGFYPEGMPGVP